MLHWTKQQARDYIVNYQFINSTPASSIEEVFQRLQTIQMDPLNVVGVNPELVLQSRLKNFTKDVLQKALYKDRYLIDGWDKQMSIFPAHDYPYLQTIRDDRASVHLNGYKKHLKRNLLDFEDDVLDIIREKGPILSKDIKLGETIQSRWGSSKPSTATLEYLFHAGKIGIYDRKNTQKRYDLIERLIPNYDDVYEFESEDSFIDYYLERRIRMKGLVWNKSSNLFIGLHVGTKSTRTKHIKRLVSQGVITEIIIEGVSEMFYVPTDALDIPICIKDQISFIAPLDNLIWDRDMILELFGFDYKWEVYTPKSKRKYGWYVIPILRGSTFIGRVEFDKQRGTKPLEVLSIWWEPGVRQSKTLENILIKALQRFANYLGTKDVIT